VVTAAAGAPMMLWLLLRRARDLDGWKDARGTASRWRPMAGIRIASTDARARVTVLVGPNGAGKSTLLKDGGRPAAAGGSRSMIATSRRCRRPTRRPARPFRNR
jgi:hypothetical protein